MIGEADKFLAEHYTLRENSLPIAFIGGAGSAILLLFSIAAAVIVGLYVFSYASHCFLVTVEQSGIGNDEVIWPDEPFLDWLWRAVSFAWLIFFWLVPVGIVLKITNRTIYSEDPGLALLFGGVTLWLFLPIAVLSSLHANSAWMVFHPRILMELARVGASTISFYFVSAILIATGLVFWFFALRGIAILIPFASLYGAFVLLVYARLLGRLTWIVMGKNIKRRSKKPRKYADEGSALPPLPPPATSSSKPEDVPDEPERVRQSGYEMYEEDEPAAQSQVPATEIMDRMRKRYAGVENRIVRKGAPRSLWKGVFGYPFYDVILGATVRLTIGGLVFGLILKMMFGKVM